MCTTVDNILKEYKPSLKGELLPIRECLVRKAAVISKLDEELLDNMEDKKEIAKEIDAAEEFQNSVHKKGIEIDLVANDRRIEVYIPEKLPYWGGIKVTGRVSTNKW